MNVELEVCLSSGTVSGSPWMYHVITKSWWCVGKKMSMKPYQDNLWKSWCIIFLGSNYGYWGLLFDRNWSYFGLPLINFCSFRYLETLEMFIFLTNNGTLSTSIQMEPFLYHFYSVMSDLGGQNGHTHYIDDFGKNAYETIQFVRLILGIS